VEKVIKFIRKYCEEDYRVTLARLTERDYDKYERRRARITPYFLSGVDDGQRRHPDTSDAWFKTSEKRVKDGALTKRKLFQVKLYRHPLFNKLYRAYLGPNKIYPNDPIYDLNLFIAEMDGTLKIVSRYMFNRFPKRQSSAYISDNGLLWNYESGKKIDTLGTLLQVRKFQAPDDRYGPEYNAE
jgi:hypothetical protein